MDDRVRREGGERWDSPADDQRDSVRARMRVEAAHVTGRGGVQLKWVFVWLIASALAILTLRHIDVVERFEQGLNSEREKHETLASDDLDEESDRATHKKKCNANGRIEQPVQAPSIPSAVKNKYPAF